MKASVVLGLIHNPNPCGVVAKSYNMAKVCMYVCTLVPDACKKANRVAPSLPDGLTREDLSLSPTSHTLILIP
jgi:hypothetical protein